VSFRVWFGGAIAALVTAASLVLPSLATAHPGTWFVTTNVAVRTTARAFKSSNPSVPIHVECLGHGPSLAPKYAGGPRFYKHFKCSVEIDLPRTTKNINVTFHVINRTYALLTSGWGPNGRDLGSYAMVF